jgi:hypothetical protein
MTGGLSFAVSQMNPGNIMDTKNVSTIQSFTSAGYLFMPGYKVLSMFHLGVSMGRIGSGSDRVILFYYYF